MPSDSDYDKLFRLFGVERGSASALAPAADKEDEQFKSEDFDRLFRLFGVERQRPDTSVPAPSEPSLPTSGESNDIQQQLAVLRAEQDARSPVAHAPTPAPEAPQSDAPRIPSLDESNDIQQQLAVLRAEQDARSPVTPAPRPPQNLFALAVAPHLAQEQPPEETHRTTAALKSIGGTLPSTITSKFTDPEFGSKQNMIARALAGGDPGSKFANLTPDEAEQLARKELEENRSFLNQLTVDLVSPLQFTPEEEKHPMAILGGRIVGGMVLGKIAPQASLSVEGASRLKRGVLQGLAEMAQETPEDLLELQSLADKDLKAAALEFAKRKGSQFAFGAGFGAVAPSAETELGRIAEAGEAPRSRAELLAEGGDAEARLIGRRVEAAGERRAARGGEIPEAGVVEARQARQAQVETARRRDLLVEGGQAEQRAFTRRSEARQRDFDAGARQIEESLQAETAARLTADEARRAQEAGIEPRRGQAPEEAPKTQSAPTEPRFRGDFQPTEAEIRSPEGPELPNRAEGFELAVEDTARARMGDVPEEHVRIFRGEGERLINPPSEGQADFTQGRFFTESPRLARVFANRYENARILAVDVPRQALDQWKTTKKGELVVPDAVAGRAEVVGRLRDQGAVEIEAPRADRSRVDPVRAREEGIEPTAGPNADIERTEASARAQEGRRGSGAALEKAQEPVLDLVDQNPEIIDAANRLQEEHDGQVSGDRWLEFYREHGGEVPEGANRALLREAIRETFEPGFRAEEKAAIQADVEAARRTHTPIGTKIKKGDQVEYFGPGGTRFVGTANGNATVSSSSNRSFKVQTDGGERLVNESQIIRVGQQGRVPKVEGFDPNRHSLADFVRLEGGINSRELMGELRRVEGRDARGRLTTGSSVVSRRGGKSLDDILQRAEEEGFITSAANDRQKFLDMLEEDLAAKSAGESEKGRQFSFFKDFNDGESALRGERGDPEAGISPLIMDIAGAIFRGGKKAVDAVKFVTRNYGRGLSRMAETTITQKDASGRSIGRQISNRIDNARRWMEPRLGRALATHERVKNSLNEAEYREFVRLLDTGRIEKRAGRTRGQSINEAKVRNAAAQMRRELDEVERLALVLKWKGFSGRRNYFPHRWLPGEEPSSEIFAELPSAVSSVRGRKVQNPEAPIRSRNYNLERSREIDAPGYRKDREVLDEYFLDAYKQLSEANFFGKRRPGEAFDPKRDQLAGMIDLINQIEHDGQRASITEGFLRMTGAQPETVGATLARRIADVNAFISLSTSGLAQLQQAAQLIADAGIRNVAKASIEMVRNPSKFREFKNDALRFGATVPNIRGEIRAAFGGMTDVGQAVRGKGILRGFMWGLNTTDQLLRVVATRAARHMIHRYEANGNRAALEYWGIKGGRKVTEADIGRVAKDLSDKSQFRADIQDLSVGFSAPHGRIIFQFQSYMHRQSGWILDKFQDIAHGTPEARKQAVRGLATFLAAAAVTGEVSQDIRAVLLNYDLAGEKDVDAGLNKETLEQAISKAWSGRTRTSIDDPALRALQNISIVGGLGIWQSLTENTWDAFQRKRPERLGGAATERGVRLFQQVSDFDVEGAAGILTPNLVKQNIRRPELFGPGALGGREEGGRPIRERETRERAVRKRRVR